MKSNRPKSGIVARELICIVAMVSVLFMVGLPALARNEAGSSADTCRNNLRQLAYAWQMYAEDNAGRIAPNNGSHPGTIGTWVKGWLDFSTSTDNTNVNCLVGFSSDRTYGHLGPYLINASVFRCPDDRSTVAIGGRIHSRVRSVSLNNWMGGNVYCGQNQYVVYRRLNGISFPSRRLVITEERPDSINDGWWITDMENNLVDYPSLFHAQGNWISFVDGHVEHRRWTDPRMLPILTPGNLIPLNIPSPNNPDMDWIRERATELR